MTELKSTYVYVINLYTHLTEQQFMDIHSVISLVV